MKMLRQIVVTSRSTRSTYGCLLQRTLALAVTERASIPSTGAVHYHSWGERPLKDDSVQMWPACNFLYHDYSRSFSTERKNDAHEEEMSATTAVQDIETDSPHVVEVETLEEHFEKAPAKKKKRKPKTNSIRSSSQTKENAERVFDWIASHTSLNKVQQWSTRLKRKAKQKRIPHHKTIEERVHYVFDVNDPSKQSRKKKQNTYTPPPVYVQKALAQFFAGNQVSTNVDEENNVDYGPSINRRNWESNVDTLMKARDQAVKQPLLWSNRENKTLRQAYKTAQKQLEEENKSNGEDDDDNTVQPNSKDQQKQYLTERAARIQTLHEWKPDQVLREEAEALASILADRLPPEEHDNLLNVLQDYVDTGNNSKKGRIRILFVHLKKCTKAHVIGIASDVANFFYVDTPDTATLTQDTTANVEGKEDDDSIESDQKESSDALHFPVSSYSIPQLVPRTSSADPRLQELHNKWNEARKQFVQKLLQLYDSPFFQLWRITPNTVMEQTEETNELDLLVKRRDERKKMDLNTKRRRRKVHLVFDAIMLQEQWAPDEQQHDDESENTTNDALTVAPPVPTDRMVFIDNLPIDILETEIIDCYSRCGPIASVEIFNKRPDLDPGPMSKKNIMKAIKSQTVRFQTRGRWERPRTPLYGIITFATNEGYEKATQDALRIFGMVIRKHPVRSTRASDIKRFFLEGIPPGFFSVDVEHTVSSLLHPNVYVCLGNGFRNYDEPTSCEFRFGSFGAAHGAFVKLEKELNMGSEECTLNWMRTPRDAVEYWTRKRGLVVP